MKPQSLLPLLLLVLGLGCARGVELPAVDPEEIPWLEAARADRRGDPDVARRLGIAYYNAEQFDAAHDVLAAALALAPDDYPALVYFGLALEEMGQLDSARAVYRQARTSPARTDAELADLEGRLIAVARAQLAAEARRAVAQESVLSLQPPLENTVAVLPWRYLGGDQDLRPLERGIAHLVLTDLSKVQRLRLLERERVHAILDELQLSVAGSVDPTTALRSGRLLRAAHIVHGTLAADVAGRMRIDAQVVHAPSGVVLGAGSASDRLQALFVMEKAVVLQIIERLGIRLTPAERRAIRERPTEDVQAFLAFSRGLERADAGDAAGATLEFDQALARDPAFRAARAARDRMRQLRRGSAPPVPLTDTRMPRRLDRDVPIGVGSRWGQLLDRAIRDVAPSRAAGLDRRLRTRRRPDRRPALPEALRQDDPRTAGTATGTVP